MQKHRCIISLGSNHLAREHFKKVWQRLTPYLSEVSSSPRVYTEPINFPHSSELFLNQILCAYSYVELEVLQRVCKSIEISCGRSEEQRELTPHLMPMDIDIVVWDAQVLKPRDFDRPYLIEGLQYLGLNVDKLRNQGFMEVDLSGES